MATGPMHADEHPIDTAMVRRLVDEQFPQWAPLAITPMSSVGTDNALFRLGDTKSVRLPRIPSAAEQLGKEQTWLPRLAGRLPLQVPEQLAIGAATAAYPWTWSVLRWIDGAVALPHRLSDQDAAAERIASFIGALHSIDATGGPQPGKHNSSRGVPLVERDEMTRRGIAALSDVMDAAEATAVWEDALAAPGWDEPGVWIHGDLQPGNILARNGRISGVIDFGCLGVGDPAYDLLPAWSLFSSSGRTRFREAVGVDDSTWRRGHGWALAFGVMVLPYYRTTNPGLAAIARFTIEQALHDAR